MEPLRIWFDPPHVRWGRVVVTVVVVTALVGVWVAQRRGVSDGAPERVPLAVAPTSAAAPATRVKPPEAAASELRQLVANAPASAASSVEFYCGLPAENVDPNDDAQMKWAAEAAHDKLQAHRARVLPGWLEEMKSSADEQVQAAAWFLELREASTGRAESARTSGVADAVNELALLAQGSRDPLTYALAFESCETYRGAAGIPACEGLKVEAWAERDPGNAYPWLFAAGLDRIDARQRTRYVDGVLASTFMRGSWGSLVPVMARAAPQGEPPLDRSVRFFEAMSAGLSGMSALSGVFGHCGENALRNGVRRQQCEHLATFLTERSDTFFEAGLGSALGKRLGWSQDRLDRLNAEREGLQRAMPEGAELAGCRGLARAEAYFADVARYGEIGALRRRQQAAQATTTTAAR